MPAQVFHLTQDGILQPIGRSQVMRVTMGLAARGLPHTILSLERRTDLDDRSRVDAVRVQLAAAGVRWWYDVFVEGGGPWQYSQNVVRMTTLAIRCALRTRPSAVHARGFPVGATALALHTLFSIPFVYDIRGFWVDQRIRANPQLAGSPSARALRVMEALFYRRAAAVVSLTELGVRIVQSGRFGTWNCQKPAVCIPTCVDYESFRLDLADAERTIPRGIVQRLAGRLVVGYVGSVNSDYRAPECIRLFGHVLRSRPDAVLLCLTGQQAQLRRLAERERLPDSSVLYANPDYDDMPAWLSRVQWGFLLLTGDFAKCGSMPTKLGEFFAAGVRPIYFGCNPEVGEWVRRCESGVSLPDLTDDALQAAARRIVDADLDPLLLRVARERARSHFSLDMGLGRYERVFRSILDAGISGRRSARFQWFQWRAP